MNILTDKRLLLCAGLIKGRVAADIGTDHGYLPAYLVSKGICERCIAADINEKPLEQARKTASEHGLEDKIDIVLSDGLKNVSLFSVSDIVIAGMGGELIASIIDECDALRQENAYHLILQPMTRPEALREYLYKNGFEIETEKCVREGKFNYSVMSVSFIGKQPDYDNDDRYRYFGRIVLSDSASAEYAKDRVKKLTAAADGMLKSEADREQGRRLSEIAAGLAKIIKYET